MRDNPRAPTLGYVLCWAFHFLPPCRQCSRLALSYSNVPASTHFRLSLPTIPPSPINLTTCCHLHAQLHHDLHNTLHYTCRWSSHRDLPVASQHHASQGSLRTPAQHLRRPFHKPLPLLPSPTRDSARPEQARFPLCAHFPFVLAFANRSGFAGEKQSTPLTAHEPSLAASSYAF